MSATATLTTDIVGKEVSLSMFTGVLIDSSSRSQTEVWSENQGKSIHSHTNHYGNIALRLDDGSEMSFSLTNIEMPARVGTRVSIICASMSRNEVGNIILISNDNTGKYVSAINRQTVEAIGISRGRFLGAMMLSLGFFGVLSAIFGQINDRDVDTTAAFFISMVFYFFAQFFSFSAHDMRSAKAGVQLKEHALYLLKKY